MTGFIAGLDDPRAEDPGVVGGKFAALARASRAGLPVPVAAAIVSTAHQAHLAAGTWPPGLREEVLAAAAGLASGAGIAVRSSAVGEDGAQRSFAGQFSSVLGVRGDEETIRAVEACWTSAGSEAARSYDRAGPWPEREPRRMAVVLQRMVEARSAGVAFGRDPLHPGRGGVVIEAVPGLADGLVSGHRTPMRVRVGRDGQVFAGGRSTARRRVLRAAPWRAVADLLARAETALLAGPLDLEWAEDRDGRLWLLQARPITTSVPSLPQAPPGAWTRHVADDLWADRLEPFMAGVMLDHAPRFDLSRTARRLGLAPAGPSLAVIDGYLYVNCATIREAAGRLPRFLRFPEMTAMMRPGTEPGALPPPGWRSLLRLAGGLALLPLAEPCALPPLCLWIAPRALRRLRGRLDRPEPGETASAADLWTDVRFDLETLALAQERNQWPYAHATALAWLLRWLAVDRLGLGSAEFLGLIGRGADNVTIAIEAWFRDTARRVGADPALREAVLARPPDQVAADPPPELRPHLESFLLRYGSRSRHRSLLEPRWAEAPGEVIGILQALLRHGGQAARQSPEEVQGRHLPLPRRLPLLVLAGFARRFLDLREESRFLLDGVLHRIRRGLLALGSHCGLGGDIFHLFPREIEDLVAGRWEPAAATDLAARRRRAFQVPSSPADYWVDGRPVFAVEGGGTLLRGTGTSAGRATGRAVVVEDPADARIERGDILVARHTDPGWTPILSVVGGLVMEEGGLLNHCSIVARELGVPAVVGIARATKRIPQGLMITVDGGAGTVRIQREEKPQRRP